MVVQWRTNGTGSPPTQPAIAALKWRTKNDTDDYKRNRVTVYNP
jgi:hypothetical protein